MTRWRWLVVLAGLCALRGTAQADERIVDYHSEIRIDTDATFTVEETIRIHTDNETIKHGIRREIPTLYFDKENDGYLYYITPLDVKRDGHAETSRVDYRGDGIQITIGDPDVTLPPGDYSYVLRYRVEDELGFFDTHDELNWNVTGAHWAYPIDHASASITVPGSVAPAQIHLTGFTGPPGSRAQDLRSVADAPSHARFETTAPLNPREGLTVAIGFPKQIITQPPGHEQRRQHALRIGLYGLAITLAFYLVAWWRVGRDPRAAPVMPLYEAPDGYSPGALRFIERHGYDDRCFGADLLDVAARGAATIAVVAGKYSIQATHPSNSIAAPEPEQELYDGLLRYHSEPLVLDSSASAKVAPVCTTHARRLNADYGKLLYSAHRGLSTIGIAFSLLAMMAMVLASPVWTLRLSAPLPLLGTDRVSPIAAIAIGALALMFMCANLDYLGRDWRAARTRWRRVYAWLATCVRLPLAIGCLVLYTVLYGVWLRPWGFVIAAAMVALNAVFFYLLPAPTRQGRQVLDQIAGLRLYLGVAESDSIARAQLPQLNADEFQRFLPYALALDVERNWTERFVAAVGPAQAAAGALATMTFYSSGSDMTSLSDFSDSLGQSFSDALFASSTLPGSTSALEGSYGSGGGSSGGGGGGGGSDSGGGGGGGSGW